MDNERKSHKEGEKNTSPSEEKLNEKQAKEIDPDDENKDHYTPLEVNTTWDHESGDQVVVPISNIDYPVRDVDTITRKIGGLNVGDSIMIELGTEDAKAIHEAEVASRTKSGLEPFPDWENVISFDIPPTDETPKRRYISGEMTTEAGNWFVVSFAYESALMNEVLESTMAFHGWIIDIAKA